MEAPEIVKETLHKADVVLYPVAGRKDKVVITLSGSEGGLEHAEKLAKYLQDNGIPALALGYFKTKHSVRSLNKIELENIKAAIDWLTSLGYEKIGIEGCSKGAEYAAAAAIAFHELNCVIFKDTVMVLQRGHERKNAIRNQLLVIQGTGATVYAL